MVVIFGLKNCDTCRKAMKQISASGTSVTLQDIRVDPLDIDQLTRFHQTFGAGLLNTRSTTWRGLSEAERLSNPLELLSKYPALMKRPVIERAGELTLGWTKETASQYGC